MENNELVEQTEPQAELTEPTELTSLAPDAYEDHYQKDRRKVRLMLEVVDRYIHDHCPNPDGLTPEQKARREELLELQAELLQVAHALVQIFTSAPPPDTEPISQSADATDPPPSS